jgi:hypothetical protein
MAAPYVKRPRTPLWDVRGSYDRALLRWSNCLSNRSGLFGNIGNGVRIGKHGSVYGC